MRRALVVVAVLLASCSGGGSGPASKGATEVPAGSVAPAPVSDEPTGWMFNGVDDAMFLSWTDDDGNLVGTLNAVSPDGSGSVAPRAFQLTGLRRGDSVTLTIEGYGISWTGRFDDGTLLLSVPNDDGTLRELELRKASIDDYNQVVAGVSDLSSARAQAAADEARRVAEQEEVAREHEAAERAAARAWEDLVSALDGAARSTSELKSTNWFDGTRRDYARALAELKGAISYLDQLISSRAECYDVRAAMSSVRAADSSVRAAGSTWRADVSSVEAALRDAISWIDAVEHGQRTVRAVDLPKNIDGVLKQARSAVATVERTASDIAKKVAAWDADVERRVAAAEDRTDACE